MRHPKDRSGILGIKKMDKDEALSVEEKRDAAGKNKMWSGSYSNQQTRYFEMIIKKSTCIIAIREH